MTRIGIVGTGRIAVVHAEAVKATQGAELVGLASRHPDSAARSALVSGLGCRIMSLTKLARHCDAVVIATPPATHFAVAERLAISPRIRAVLMESPVATTLQCVDRICAVLTGRPVMTATNLLHAPPFRRFMETIAVMDPHHLELRLAVPTPDRDPTAGQAFGGGVTMDPGGCFLPLLMAALGTPVESVTASGMLYLDGRDRSARVVLHGANGHQAKADLSWNAQVAEASLEAADDHNVGRIEIWPEPTTEINGVSHSKPLLQPHELLNALGFTGQIQQLVRVASGRSIVWPTLDVGRAGIAVAVAAALSAQRGGRQVGVTEVPPYLSPYEVLSGRAA